MIAARIQPGFKHSGLRQEIDDVGDVFDFVCMLAAEQTDVFKKDMAPLQSAVDGVITSTGAQVMPAGRSRAAYH